MRSSAESTDNSALLFILFLFNGPIFPQMQENCIYQK